MTVGRWGLTWTATCISCISTDLSTWARTKNILRLNRHYSKPDRTRNWTGLISNYYIMEDIHWTKDQPRFTWINAHLHSITHLDYCKTSNKSSWLLLAQITFTSGLYTRPGLYPGPSFCQYRWLWTFYIFMEPTKFSRYGKLIQNISIGCTWLIIGIRFVSETWHVTKASFNSFQYKLLFSSELLHCPKIQSRVFSGSKWRTHVSSMVTCWRRNLAYLSSEGRHYDWKCACEVASSPNTSFLSKYNYCTDSLLICRKLFIARFSFCPISMHYVKHMTTKWSHRLTYIYVHCLKEIDFLMVEGYY